MSVAATPTLSISKNETVAKVLVQANKVKTTEKIATDFQAAQFKQRMHEYKRPEDDFEMFDLTSRTWEKHHLVRFGETTLNDSSRSLKKA